MIADFVGSFQNTIGRVRFILKDGLKYLPWYGFYFKQVSKLYKRFGYTCIYKHKN